MELREGWKEGEGEGGEDEDVNAREKEGGREEGQTKSTYSPSASNPCLKKF